MGVQLSIKICYGILKIFCLNLSKLQWITVKKLDTTENLVGLLASEACISYGYSSVLV